jgi:type I restriction enzyme S subunit
VSFPRYPRHKDSGVKGLGDVPGHWEVKRLRQLGRLLKGSGGSKEDVVESGVPCVRYGDLYTTHDNFIHEARTRVTPARAHDYTPIQYGDILFAGSGETFEEIGKSAVSLIDGPAVCGGDLIILRPIEAMHPPFMGYVCDSEFSAKQKAMMGRGTTVKHIYPDELKALVISVPPFAEQVAIATFLSREIAKIDALVAEQRRLIGLLREKRQAVISRAVTKGLNPQVPMKPSGIEWLGAVPAHWEYAALTRIARRVVVGIAEAATHAYVDKGIPILRSTNVRPGRIIGEILHLDPAFAGERDSKRIDAGDLVTVRTGNAGVTAVVPPEFDGCQCFTMLITSLNEDESGEFCCFWMNSIAAQCYFTLEGWGTAQVNISVPILKALPVPIPPRSEQLEIVAFLDHETAKLDALTAEAEKAIDILKERRTALISAAVTGKIDVRGLVEIEAA